MIRKEEHIEVHRGSVGSPFAAAQLRVRMKHPRATILTVGYSGERCEHGDLLVLVTYEEPS